MPLKVLYCPHCKEKVHIQIQKSDIDLSGRLPAPLYVLHSFKGCKKHITVYFDSNLRVSLAFKGTEDSSKWKFVKTIESES